MISSAAQINLANNIQQVGAQFEQTKLFEAQAKTWDAIHTIKVGIQVGMSQGEAIEWAKQCLNDMGFEKNWHRPIVRFAQETLKTYAMPFDNSVILKQSDIYFLDLGPVWKGYEGDAGQTFVIGDDPDMLRCAIDAKVLWSTVRDYWLSNRKSGAELYEFAIQTAQQMGWELRIKNASGHRISDFPHAVYHKGSIQQLEFSPAPNAWILEIQIRHPHRPFGAFYEDLL